MKNVTPNNLNQKTVGTFEHTDLKLECKITGQWKSLGKSFSVAIGMIHYLTQHVSIDGQGCLKKLVQFELRKIKHFIKIESFQDV